MWRRVGRVRKGPFSSGVNGFNILNPKASPRFSELLFLWKRTT